MTDRDLFLHELIDIVGQHQWDYMEHIKGQAGHEKVNFELLGTWYTMGITGRWPQVVNIWEIPEGWDGWQGKVDRLGMKRQSNRHLEAWWSVAYTYRTGGFDRLLGAVPGCPTMATLATEGVKGTLFVHELTEVRPGTALNYLSAVRDERVPLMAEHDHRLVGLWEVMMTDSQGLHGVGHRRDRPRPHGQGTRRGARLGDRRKGRLRRGPTDRGVAPAGAPMGNSVEGGADDTSPRDPVWAGRSATR